MLEIRLFGPMEVRVGGKPLPRLRSRKGLWLLALLALRGGRDVDRSWVAGTLWPDSEEADARRSLRQSLHDLRLALGSDAARLSCESPRTLRLDVAGLAIDVLAFDAAMEQSDPASLEAAVRLYRGPLLEDCAEEWSLEERRRREQNYGTALETLAAAATAQQQHGIAADYLRLAVGLDAYREETQCALMHALAGAGHPAGALLVYRQFRELLQREMAAEPTEETTALFRRLREEGRRRAALPGLPSPKPVVPRLTPLPSSLPLALTELIGRDDAVQDVLSQLTRSRLVTLTGTGGIGKTRLAVQVAEEIADDHPDGVCFVNLAPVTEAATVPQVVLTVLGASEGDMPQEPIEALRRFLNPKRLLLVLDNCEHLIDACASLTEALLSHCSGLQILTTSRQALGLRGETVWRVPTLTLPPTAGKAGADAPLLSYAAIRLFVARAGTADSTFALTPHNAPTVVQVCRQLDGIPLAIELAAARLRALALEEIAARLPDSFGLLAGGGRALPPRQQTLAAALDWSWGLLRAPERTLLVRLSVFVGGWTLAGAEAVCPDGAEISGDQVLDLLTALVDHSLVVFRPPAVGARGEARYHLLETIRQYAQGRLRECGDRDAVRDRHLDYVLEMAEQIKPKLTGAEQAQWLNFLETEHDNLRAALAWCEQRPGPAQVGLRLARILWRFWFVRGHLSEGRQWLARMLARDAGTPLSSDRAKALTASGNLAQIQGDYGAAHIFYEESLAISRQLGDQDDLADTYNSLGNMVSDQGDYAHARALYQESLVIYRRLGKRQGVANALSNLGLMDYEQGDYASARPFWEESLLIERELKNQGGIASSLGSLGLLADAEDDYEAAYCLYDECLTLYRQLGDQPCIAKALINQANLSCRQGDFGAARALYEESLALGHRLSNLPIITHGLEGIAAVAQGQNDCLRAIRVLGTAHALREATGYALSPTGRQESETQIALLQKSVGRAAFLSAFAEGQGMTWEQAVSEQESAGD